MEVGGGGGGGKREIIYLSLHCHHQNDFCIKIGSDESRVGGQLRGDKECPFSGVPKSGRVWRKVPEGDALSVRLEQ